MQWVQTKDRLPETQSLNEPDNTYYVVRVDKYGLQKAMYTDYGWCTSYFTKIIVPVIEWLDEEDEIIEKGKCTATNKPKRSIQITQNTKKDPSGVIITIQTPFSMVNNSIYRSRGGKFNKNTKEWEFPDTEATHKMIDELFGSDESVIISVEIDYNNDIVCVDGNEVHVDGYQLARRPYRDSRVFLPEGVVLYSGKFDESGGSVKNPRVTGDDMVFHVNIRKDFAERYKLQPLP